MPAAATTKRKGSTAFAARGWSTNSNMGTERRTRQIAVSWALPQLPGRMALARTGPSLHRRWSGDRVRRVRPRAPPLGDGPFPSGPGWRRHANRETAYDIGQTDRGHHRGTVRHRDGRGRRAFLILSALVFYSVLYRYGLVPRWLAGLGLAAALLYLPTVVLAIFGVVGREGTTTNLIALAIPFAVHEMVLAAWLIVRGFDTAGLGSAHGSTGSMQP